MAGYLPSNLENLAGNDSLSQALDFVGWGQKRRFNEEALRAQRVNRDMALEDLYHTKQMNPMRVEEMSLKNALAGLRNEGQGYDNRVAKRNLDVRESIPLEKEQQAAMSKIMTQLSDDDWKQTQNDIYKMMSSKEPKEQVLGQKLYTLLPEMVKLRTSLASRETIADKNNASRANIAAARGVAASQKSDLARQGPKGLESYITYAKLQANSATDPETRLFWLTEAENTWNAMQQAKLAQAQARNAGNVDMAAGSGLPTRPTPAIPPLTPTKPQSGEGKADPLGIR